MDKSELAYMSIAEQAKLIEKKEISPVDLVDLYLERIETWDGFLHSWITVCAERAREQARKAEAEIAKGHYRGPLHGIPYGVKDQICTGDVPTTMASIIQPDFGEGVTASVIERLDSAGAILLGKQNLHEFGKGSSIRFHFGEPRNPWNPNHTASSSSTGSGVAPSAGLCSFSLGEDTGGSIRGPAWANGVVGIRATYGRVSRYGGIMHAWTQDTIGPLTRTVGDNATVLKAIAGFDPKDSLSSDRPVPDFHGQFTEDLKGLKLGLVREMSVAHALHPEVKQNLEESLDVLRALGATVEEVSLPYAKYAIPLQMMTSDADVASMFVRKWLRTHWDKFDQGTRTRIAAAALVPAPVYNRAMRARRLVRRQVLDAFQKYDGLLALMNTVPPEPIEQTREKVTSPEDVKKNVYKTRRICTYPFSMANITAMSVPAGFTTDGLPLSIQIAAMPFDEQTMYRIGNAFERATPWHTRHPDLNETVAPLMAREEKRLAGE